MATVGPRDGSPDFDLPGDDDKKASLPLPEEKKRAQKAAQKALRGISPKASAASLPSEEAEAAPLLTLPPRLFAKKKPPPILAAAALLTLPPELAEKALPTDVGVPSPSDKELARIYEERELRKTPEEML
jgi:hypothetical protein